MPKPRQVRVNCPECDRSHVISWPKKTWPTSLKFPGPPLKLMVTLERCDGCGNDYDASEALRAAVSSEVDRQYPHLAASTEGRRIERTYVRQVWIKGESRRVRIDVQRGATAARPYSAYVFIEEGASDPSIRRIKMTTYGHLPFTRATIDEALASAVAHLQSDAPG